jgi:hypothetical protein
MAFFKSTEFITEKEYREAFAFFPNTKQLTTHWGGGYDFDDLSKHRQAAEDLADALRSLPEDFFQKNKHYDISMYLNDIVDKTCEVLKQYYPGDDSIKQTNEHISTIVKNVFEDKMKEGCSSLFEVTLSTLSKCNAVKSQLVNMRFKFTQKQKNHVENILKSVLAISKEITSKDDSCYDLFEKCMTARQQSQEDKASNFGMLRDKDSILFTKIIDTKAVNDLYSEQYQTIVKYSTLRGFNTNQSKLVGWQSTGKYDGSIDFYDIKVKGAFSYQNIAIVHSPLKLISQLMSDLKKISIQSILDLEGKDFFNKLADIYQYICDVTPLKRGSSLTAQMFISVLMKAKYPDKPLIPFSYSIGINPDIAAMLLPKKIFISEFTTFFNQDLFEHHYGDELRKKTHCTIS